MDVDKSSFEAEEALAEIARVRSTTRGVVRTLAWQTTAMWGAIFLVSVAVWLAVESNTVSGLYWLISVPIGIAVTWRLESKLPRLRDAAPYSPWFVVISAFMVIGAFGTWWVFDERLSSLIWYSVLLGGFAAFAAIDRQEWAVAGIALLWVWGLVVWLSTGESQADLDLTLALFATSIGAGMLGTGFGQRLGRR